MRVFSNTSIGKAMIAGFRRRYPGIEVEYRNVGSQEIQRQMVNGPPAGEAAADVLWSSAMDIQTKLINDGHAQTYRSPEAGALPDWAKWRDQGYGVSAEPVMFAYNRRLLPESRAPRSHADLLKELRAEPQAWQGALTLFDPDVSGVGLLYLSQDKQLFPEADALYGAIAASDPGLYRGALHMMRGVEDGRHRFAYNIVEAFAAERAAANPDIAVIRPEDYYIVVSRVAFINRDAPHPNAARLFLDYMLSREGQRLLASERIAPVRTDLTPDIGRSDARSRPIRIGPGLLANHDQQRREDMLSEWRRRLVKDEATAR